MDYSALINGGEAKRSRKARGSEWTAVRILERFLQAVQQQPISPKVSMDQPARGTERCKTTTRRLWPADALLRPQTQSATNHLIPACYGRMQSNLIPGRIPRAFADISHNSLYAQPETVTQC